MKSEEATHLHSSQGGFRAHVTKTYTQIVRTTESTEPAQMRNSQSQEENFEGVRHENHQRHTRGWITIGGDM